MKIGHSGLAGLLALTAWTSVEAAAPGSIVLTPIGTFRTASAEIGSYDPDSRLLFTVGGAANQVNVLRLDRPWQIRPALTIDLAPYGGGVNSVATRDGIIAVAVEAVNRQAPGKVVFFDGAGRALSSVTVGAVPDMLTFTPDGSYLLVANEGEPLDYCAAGLANDPEGSVSVIDLRGGVGLLTQAAVRTAGFAAWNAGAPAGVRIFGPNASVAQDLEPEYIAVSPDSRTAWVTLQENNALAVVDIASATVTSLAALGTQDHSQPRNALDASDRDDAVRIVPRPVQGLYMPDTVAAYRAGGQDYLVLANEGDARDYECFGEETRVGDLDLDAAAFPAAATLQADEELGRLRTTTATGDMDDDGDNDAIFTFGSRSFSIRTAAGALVWDSGSDFELITAAALPGEFNSTNDENGSFDSRSDDKGPEPEGLTVGNFRGREYAFISLERVGGIMVYDVTDPRAPFFVQYVNGRDFGGDAEAGTAGDLAPEGVLYIPREQSPINRALLVVTHEVSGTVTVYSIKPRS
ncbi:MAG TPA: choice-of-anchor I family protein [Thermoanaerobaculia bacterium]|nr:choice-of-anchor I family protein [Thermoanaerobaculia bacterium]